MKFFHNTVKMLIVLPFMFALFLTGCTHMQPFTAPGVASIKIVVSGMDFAETGFAVIGKIEDRRPAGTEMFIFSNWPNEWIYQSDAKAEQLLRGLIKEGLQRRGITEVENPEGVLMVTAEITDFSGDNAGVFYPGNCYFKIGSVITIKGPGVEKTLTVIGTGLNRIGRLSEENLDLLMSKTYVDFLNNLDVELHAAGF